MLGNFLFNLANFCVIVSYLTKLLTLDVLISTAVRAVVVVARLTVIVVILFLASFISALRVVLVAKLGISGISSSAFSILALYTSLLTTSFFIASLSLLKSTGTGTNFSHLIYLLYFLNWLNLLVHF